MSVIVAAGNRPATLPGCVAAIELQLGCDDELLVVDNGPNMRSPADLRNRGAVLARGDVLLFVDSDIELRPDALERIRAALGEDPELVGLFGSYDDTPAAPGTVSVFRNLLHHYVHASSAGPAVTFWAGIGAIRRTEFLASGGFCAARYPRPMLEDVELGLRLTRAGHRIALVPDVRGTHLKRWTLPGMVRTDVRDRGIPWTRLLVEQRRLPAVLNLRWRHRASSAAVAGTGVLVLAGRRRAALGSAVTFVGLNAPLYELLARRGGARLAVAGVGLHAVHHAAGLVSVPLGLAAHVRRGGPPAPPGPLVDLHLVEEARSEPGLPRAVRDLAARRESAAPRPAA